MWFVCINMLFPIKFLDKTDMIKWIGPLHCMRLFVTSRRASLQSFSWAACQCSDSSQTCVWWAWCNISINHNIEWNIIMTITDDQALTLHIARLYRSDQGLPSSSVLLGWAVHTGHLHSNYYPGRRQSITVTRINYCLLYWTSVIHSSPPKWQTRNYLVFLCGVGEHDTSFLPGLKSSDKCLDCGPGLSITFSIKLSTTPRFPKVCVLWFSWETLRISKHSHPE